MTKHDSSDKNRRKSLTVINGRGTRQRFLRGMITHDLVQRGFAFDDAYAVAQVIRDRLSGRDEVTTTEIRDLVAEQVEKQLGVTETAPDLESPIRPVPERWVLYDGRRQPFSRGLLARSIHAAGPDLDRAYRLIAELEEGLRKEGIHELRSDEIAHRVAEILEHFEGADTARRYRLVRRLHSLPRPLVVYLGGASGTGKSTLALELAPLLRIYRITATDTVRQVMRMVFSPEILPAIHASSFEVAPPIGQPGLVEPFKAHDPEHVDRLLGSFEEQATRVNVGVRAVVERAIAENLSIVVEGVHLYPPLIPFPDLEGAAYQIPMILTLPDPEDHRTRFLTRGRRAQRHAERYLESFRAIRAIHEHLLQQAEAHDVALLDTSHEEPAPAALRTVTTLLEKRLPSLADPTWSARPVGPALLVVIDGLADRPVRALGGRTPLQAARTPTFDRLAREGRCGLADPVAPGVVPDTAAGTLALFGQSPLAMRRGPVEALGAGLELQAGDIALRGNFATLDGDGRVIDRRAGRIREHAEELAEVLDRLELPGAPGREVEIRVRAATEHRLAIVLRGEGLSSAIHGSDPGDGAIPCRPLTPRPDDPHDERAVYTASVLALFEQEARKILARHAINGKRRKRGKPQANAVLTRGAGTVHRLAPIEESGVRLKVACVGGDRTILGLAAWLGAEIFHEPEMTANLDTDLGVKFTAVRRALRHHDLVILHLKGADIAAHDRRPDRKAEFIEKIDRHLGKLLGGDVVPLRIAVASDHATLSESGQHAADPLPVLIWGEGIRPDAVELYDEQSVAGGGLQRFPLQMLLGRLYQPG